MSFSSSLLSHTHSNTMESVYSLLSHTHSTIERDIEEEKEIMIKREKEIETEKKIKRHDQDLEPNINSHVISGSSSPSVSSSTLISNSGDRGHLRGAFHGNSSHRGSYTSSRGYNSRGSSSHGSHGGSGSCGGYSRGGGSVPCGDRKCTHCGSSGQNMSRHYSNFSRHYSSL
ncbi:unnamed protein product [Camellia sinensis]